MFIRKTLPVLKHSNLKKWWFCYLKRFGGCTNAVHRIFYDDYYFFLPLFSCQTLSALLIVFQMAKGRQTLCLMSNHKKCGLNGPFEKVKCDEKPEPQLHNVFPHSSIWLRLNSSHWVTLEVCVVTHWQEKFHASMAMMCHFPKEIFKHAHHQREK